MKIDISNIEIPDFKTGIALVKAISDLGYETCLAGGCVRDIVRHELGQTDTLVIHDIDIATAAPIEVLKKHFHTASNNGEAHGTILVGFSTSITEPDTMFEVTHFRTDGIYSDGRHPDYIELANTFREDSTRRDFTINAMGLGWDGEVIDYHKGVEHVRQKLICAVGDPCMRFYEDSLRIVRGCRFAANFGYTIETSTKHAMVALASKLTSVSNERFRGEFLKISDYAELIPEFLNWIHQVGAFSHIPAFKGLTYLNVVDTFTNVSEVTEKNLFPILAFEGTENNLAGFVPTREEKALFRWYKKYRDVFYSNSMMTGRIWTNMVEFASGDYKTAVRLAKGTDDSAYPAWFVEKFPKALFIVDNPPDLSMLASRVKALGIPQGKEFGEKLKDMVETAYKNIADSIPYYRSEVRGNSRILYVLKSIEPICE